MKNKKQEFSKTITVVSFVMFAISLVLGFFFTGYLIFHDTVSIPDLAFLGSAIATTGLVWQLVTKYYMNKAGLENTTSIRKSMYGEISKVRLEFIEGVLNLEQKYDTTREHINDIDANQSPFDEFSLTEENKIVNRLDEEEHLNSLLTSIDQ